jgi:integrase
MAKRTHKLSDLKIKALRKAGLHGDGDGLYLKVSPTGTRSWMLRFKVGGQPSKMGLGPYPEISLSEARNRARDARAQLARGINPLADKRQRAAAQRTVKHVVTFAEATERYIAAHESSWRNAKHRQQWRNTLATYAAPVIGKTPVHEVVMDDVLRVLEPIWQTKPETASRVRGRIENVLDWAKVRGLRSGENPAAWRGHLSHVLPARNKARSVQHHAALPWRQMPEFIAALRANSAISARALEFTILTAARTSEVVEAKWAEVDLEVGAWTVPKQRMKADREHRVPLTDAAVAALRALPRLAGNDYLFPGARKGRPLSNMAMLELLRGMRPGLTVHGFRSTFRDWAAEATSFPRELAEAALAHVLGSASERAYQRGDLFEKRREMMTAWSAFAKAE